MTRMTGAQIIVKALSSEKVHFLFELIGSHTLHIYDVLRNEKRIHRITVRYENDAAIMAHTVGRLTDEPGVCLVTAGPGATNSVTGVATAFASASPMVHLSGATPTRDGVSSFHGVDDPLFLEKIFKPVTKTSIRLDTPKEAPRKISQAFALSSTGRRGPVHMSLPQRFQKESGDVARYERVKIAPRHATDAQIRRISRMLDNSKKPVICLGEEAVRLPVKEITYLAEKIRAPVISTVEAIGIFPQDHYLSAGYLDEFFRQHPIAIRALEDSDCLLIVGLRPGSPSVKFLERDGPSEKVFFHEEPYAGESRSDNQIVFGDVNLNVRLLAQSICGHQQNVRKSWSEVKLNAQKMASAPSKSSGVLHPGYAMAALRPFLQQECIFAADVGSAEVWLRDCISVWHRSRYLFAGQYGGMGFGIPAGIASKLLFPNRQVISVVGDGGLLMTLGELATISQHSLNLKIIVLNDSRYGMISLFQRQQFHARSVSVDLTQVDFAKIAQGFGVKGIRVQDHDDLKQAYNQILLSNEPGLIDIVTEADAPYLF